MAGTMLTPLLLGMALNAWAAAPPSATHALPPVATEAVLELPPLDAPKARQAADAALRLRGGPVAYGRRSELTSMASALLAHDAAWTALPDGRWVWRTEVLSPGALTLDFGFAPYRLPASAELWISGSDGQRLGPFTDHDNSPKRSLYTPLLAGQRATIELVVDGAERDRVELALADVASGFRPQAADGGPETKARSCNVDVACDAADPWRQQVGSVARYTFRQPGSASTFLCTGQLLVDARGSTAQRLFATAAHCLTSEAAADSMVFYWRYESDTCRTPGSAASGQVLPLSIAAATQEGADLLASHSDSDFTMVRLEDAVPAAAQPYFSGWDRVAQAADRVASIHHPQGDEKRISVEEDDVFPTTRSFTVDTIDLPPGHGWDVTGWDLGTTEGGSSGSGLWNEDRRFIGVLSGGTSGCGNDDVYGRLQTAWEGDGTPATRMRDWLDPAGSGAQVADGAGLCEAPAVSLALSDATPVAGQLFTIEATASGGAGAFHFAWDLDGDGTTDREGTDAELALSYPAATSTQVRVTVTDAEDCSGVATRALDVAGPELVATAQAAQQLCGDADALIEPGERWRLPVVVRNDGDAPFASEGRALFVPGRMVAPIGPDAYGYSASTSTNGDCPYAFVDIASGATAAPVLATAVFDGNSFGNFDDARIVDPVAVAAGMQIYGQAVSEAVMSTNGYLSFSNSEGGGDWSIACPEDIPNNASAAPRLHVFHGDLVVGGFAGAGLRHRFFAECPRPAQSGASRQPCDVFQWSGMQLYAEDGAATGNFEFQAVLYPASGQIVYQYRTASPDAGASASIGLVDAVRGGTQSALPVACAMPGAAPAQSAVCIYDKGTTPESVGRVEASAPVLGSLAAGASRTLNVDQAVPADAACGAPLVLDFLGAANATQSAPASQRILDAQLGGTQASCNVSSCSAQAPAVDARHGLFFQHARGGNGLLNFVYGAGAAQSYGGIWYTARADRSPQWYTLQGEYADNLGIAPIRAFTNAAAPGGFDPQSAQVGTAWIAQPARDDVLMAWRFADGRRGIELLHSSGLPFATPNRTQQWYPPSQPGWGAGVESNSVPGGGYSEFWATFLYDDAGDGRWVVGSSGLPGGVVDLVGFAVHCPGCPFLPDALQRALPAGTLSRQYTGPQRALLDTDILLPPPLSGSWLRDDLPIEPVGPIEQP